MTLASIAKCQELVRSRSFGTLIADRRQNLDSERFFSFLDVSS
jgi:hypothetical protein